MGFSVDVLGSSLGPYEQGQGCYESLSFQVLVDSKSPSAPEPHRSGCHGSRKELGARCCGVPAHEWTRQRSLQFYSRGARVAPEL